MQQEIREAVQAALADLGAQGVAFVIERPGDSTHGDYSTNAALVAAKQLGKNPRDVAQLLKKRLSEENGLAPWREEIRGPFRKKDFSEAVKKVEIAGPGFVNFFLSRGAIANTVEEAATNDAWGANALYAGKMVLVEYTSPNLFKPLHIGNLVGNILGESLTRLIETSGGGVKRLNYPSDIGLTVAKGVWGLQKHSLDPHDIEQLGSAYVLGNAAYEENAAAKQEIEDINKKLYAGDPGLTALREVGIKTSLAHLDGLCRILGTAFDTEFFESQAAPEGVRLVRIGLERGIFETGDGAVVYHGEAEGLHTRVFINSQRLPTYEAKDLGLFSLKLKAYPEFDLSITVTGSEQKEYFKVLFAASKKVFSQEIAGKELLHVSNGFLRLTTGKMSSRKGNVITGESLLADLTDASKEKMQGRKLLNPEETAQQVAVGAIKYAVLKQGSGKDIIFDPEQSLSLEGDSGPYLQYAHTRALSLLKRANAVPQAKAKNSQAKGKAWPSGLERSESANFSSEFESDSMTRAILERLLIHFPEVVERAARELEPHYVTTYLTELAGAFNSWYARERVIGGENEAWGLLLTQAFANTLRQGLHLLGIPAPEEM